MECALGFLAGFGIAFAICWAAVSSGRGTIREMQKLIDEQKEFIGELRANK